MKIEHKLMDGLGSLIVRYYKLIPVLGAVLIVLSLVSASQIRMKTQIKDLLPEDNPMIASYDEISEEFDGGESIFFVVKGPDKEAMAAGARAFVRELEERPEAMQYVTAINLEVDADFVKDWGLLLQEREDLERTLPMLRETNLLPLIRGLNDNFEATYSSDSAEEELSNTKQENETVALYQQMEAFFTRLQSYLESPVQESLNEQGRTLAELFLIGDRLNYAWDNSMLVFTVQPNISSVDFDELTQLMEEVREAKRVVEARMPGVVIDYTGNIPIQADEQLAMGLDLLVPALVALVVILVLFVFSFEQIRSIVMTLLALLIGIIFNYGLVGATFREINMMTSFMSTLLIGLGIDYGIQILTTFNAMRSIGHEPENAIKLTFRKAGMGTMLAAFTTAIAFVVMALTGSKAFSQFGLTAATGIVLCFLSMVTILPSLLLLFGKKDMGKVRLPKIDYGFLGDGARWIGNHRGAVFTGGLIVTALLGWAAFGMRVEYNFMNLEPQEMPSVVTYNEMTEELGLTPSQSMVIADSVEEAHELTEKLEEEPLVADVTSVAYFIPREADVQGRLETIREARDEVGLTSSIEYRGAELEELLYEIQRVEWNLIEIADLSVAGLGEENKILRKRNAMIREIFGAEVGQPGDEVIQNVITLIESDPELYGRRLDALDARFAPAVSAIARRMVAVDRRVTVDDLPRNYRDAFFSGNGERNLVTAYPVDGMFIGHRDVVPRQDRALPDRCDTDLVIINRDPAEMVIKAIRHLSDTAPGAADCRVLNTVILGRKVPVKVTRKNSIDTIFEKDRMQAIFLTQSQGAPGHKERSTASQLFHPDRQLLFLIRTEYA